MKQNLLKLPLGELRSSVSPLLLVTFSASALVLSACSGGSFLLRSERSSASESLNDVRISKSSAAVLNVLAHAEGTKDRYDYIFSYVTFTNFADHPRRVICSSGYCSDAAGRYQFLSTTWDETRTGAQIRDFQPRSQDVGALYRMEMFRGAHEHNQVLNRSAFERLIYKINLEWASLPGSPYGQPTHSMSSLWTVYQNSL